MFRVRLNMKYEIEEMSLVKLRFKNSYILRRPQNLAKYPPIICPANRIVGGDFAKFCVLPRINELYNLLVNLNISKHLIL